MPKIRTNDQSQFYTVAKVGKTRELTPEGFLLCRDVAIARTGDMVYGAGEVPLEDEAGLITVTRDADEVFRPETLASFEGKSVTVNHPDDWVCPENWSILTKGTVQNVRRGTGIEDHLMFGDLLITDKATIDAVGKEDFEVSCGYDADYTQTSKGKGKQSNIIGNHVALVDKGRCGSRCAIGDKDMATKPQKKGSWKDRFWAAFSSQDAEAMAEVLEDKKTEDDEGEDPDKKDDDVDSKTGDAILSAIKAMDAKFTKQIKAMDKRIKDSAEDPEKETEDEDPDADPDNPTGDEADLTVPEKGPKKSTEGEETHTGDSLQNIRSRIAILAPTLRLPTLDAKSKDLSNVVKNCKCKALDEAYKTELGRNAIDPFLDGRTADFEKLPRATLDAAFIGAAQMIKQHNNAQGVRTGITTKDFGRAPTSIADINAQNRKYWADRQAK